MKRLAWLVLLGVLGLCLDTIALVRDASACGSIFGGPHCRDQTQVCQNGCPLLSCQQLLANFDNPPNALSSSYFAGAIGHCAARGERTAILDCAWQEVVQNFPEVASTTCLKTGLFTSARTQQLLQAATRPPSCPVWSCNTQYRKCEFECPLRDDLSCDDGVAQLDGDGGFFWKAVGHCNGVGTDRAAIGDCAWREAIAKYPHMANQACVKQRILATASTQRAIDADITAWQHGSCGIPRDLGHPEQGSCNRFEKCLPGCPTGAPPALSCIDAAAELDGAGRFFWTGVHHCQRDGIAANPDAVTSCAWSEAVGRYPSLNGNTCVHDRLVQSASGSQAIREVVAALGTIAYHHTSVSFPATEPCAHPDAAQHVAVVPADHGSPLFFEPSIPRALLDTSTPSGAFNSPAAHNIGGDEGRLHADLRAAARVGHPLTCSLPLASALYGRAGGPDELAFAQAYADLSVTGRRAFAEFRGNLPQDSYCASLRTPAAAAGCPALAGAAPTDAQLVAGCHKALDRAYQVANFLRTGEALAVSSPTVGPDGNDTPAAAAERARRLRDRGALGYIAVSGEDDQPHRPVNVPSSDYPQFDLDVDVGAPLAVAPNPRVHRVHTRFTIAQSNPGAGTVVPPRRPPPGMRGIGRSLAPDPVPAIAGDAEILLFIHGMDSRAEEADDITRALFKLVAHGPKNLVVISVDLPSSGYADNLDYEAVSALSAIGNPKLTVVPPPGLPIPPEVYTVLVTALASLGVPPPPPVIPPGVPLPDFQATGQVPVLDFLENFVVAFVDTLDAGRAPGVPALHIKGRIKAAVGGSLGANLSFRLGRRANAPWLPKVVVWSPASIWGSLGEGMNLLNHIGPRTAFERANNRDSRDPLDLTAQRAGLRRAFFAGWDQATVPILVPQAQSDTWTSMSYQCHSSSIAAARLDRHETYDARFQTWHWRLAAEQLLYSHQSIDATGKPRFMANTRPMLLACGTEDHVPFNNICPNTQAVALRMTMTPGKALFLQQTGHSIDNERPSFWAAEVKAFLDL